MPLSGTLNSIFFTISGPCYLYFRGGYESGCRNSGEACVLSLLVLMYKHCWILLHRWLPEQSRRHQEALVGLAPRIEIRNNLNVKAPLHERETPCTYVKPRYWQLSGYGSFPKFEQDRHAGLSCGYS